MVLRDWGLKPEASLRFHLTEPLIGARGNLLVSLQSPLPKSLIFQILSFKQYDTLVFRGLLKSCY